MVEQVNGVYRIRARSAIADGIMILLFIGGVVGVLFMCFGFLFEPDEPIMWLGIGALGVACFVAGVLMLKVFKFTKLVAEVSEEGIREYASKVSNGLIRWEEIEKVFIYFIAAGGRRGWPKTEFIGIVLKDQDAYIEKLNIIQRGIIKAGPAMGFSAPINIPCNMLGEDAEKLLEICNDMLKKRATV